MQGDNAEDSGSESVENSSGENSLGENGQAAPTYSMRKIGLVRKGVRVGRGEKRGKYPGRTKISPVRWWMGERAVYDARGYLIGKDVRK